MTLRYRLAALVLPVALAAGAVGCTQYTAIAQAPDNKVFVTKFTSYIVWTSNKMQLCDFGGGVAKNCTEITQQ